MILVPSQAGEQAPGIAATLVGTEAIGQTAARMRAMAPIAPETIARSLSSVIAAWRDPAFTPRRTTIGAIATAWGYNESLLGASLDALLAPFTADSLADFAARRPAMPADAPGAMTADCDPAARVIGMVMPETFPAPVFMRWCWGCSAAAR